MLKTDLPKLTPQQYGGANCLATEVWKAKSYGELFPNSAAAIQSFFDGLATAQPATSGTVTDGQTFAVTGGTVTMHVTNHVVTATLVATP